MVDAPGYAAGVVALRGAGRRWAYLRFFYGQRVTSKAQSKAPTRSPASIHLALPLDDGMEYLVNLSGAEYPLVSTVSQRQLLGQPRGGPFSRHLHTIHLLSATQVRLLGPLCLRTSSGSPANSA